MARGLEELVKDENEIIIFNMDFTKRLAKGETITSVSSYTSISSNNVTGSSNITFDTVTNSDSVVQVKISGGTPFEQYTIEITIVTSLGSTKIGQGLLRVV